MRERTWLDPELVNRVLWGLGLVWEIPQTRCVTLPLVPEGVTPGKLIVAVAMVAPAGILKLLKTSPEYRYFVELELQIELENSDELQVCISKSLLVHDEPPWAPLSTLSSSVSRVESPELPKVVESDRTVVIVFFKVEVSEASSHTSGPKLSGVLQTA